MCIHDISQLGHDWSSLNTPICRAHPVSQSSCVAPLIFLGLVVAVQVLRQVVHPQNHFLR